MEKKCTEIWVPRDKEESCVSGKEVCACAELRNAFANGHVTELRFERTNQVRVICCFFRYLRAPRTRKPSTFEATVAGSLRVSRGRELCPENPWVTRYFSPRAILARLLMNGADDGCLPRIQMASCTWSLKSSECDFWHFCRSFYMIAPSHAPDNNAADRMSFVYRVDSRIGHVKKKSSQTKGFPKKSTETLCTRLYTQDFWRRV